MRCVVITEHGPPEVLQVQDRPDPQPGPGEVRVAVKAAGLNFSDLMARVGLYPDAPEPACVVGYEVAGEIESLGDGVEGWQVGQRVMSGTRFGGQAELVVVSVDNLLPMPDDWTFEEGAAFQVVYATAYAAVLRYGALHEGERMLIHAAAGGVGIAATQIAKLSGVGQVFGTASASKHDAIRGFGVDHPIDYRSTDFVKEVRRIDGKERPLDLALDAIGGASFRKSWSLLRPGGRLVCFGFASAMSGERRNTLKAATQAAQMPIFHPLRMMPQSKSVIGLNMLTLWDEFGSLQQWIEPLANWLESGALRPVVAEAFPAERAAEAHRYMAEGRNIGKVVITF